MSNRIRLAKGVYIETRALLRSQRGENPQECAVGDEEIIGWRVVQVGGQKFDGEVGEHALSGLVRWIPAIGQILEMNGQRILVKLPPVCSKDFPLSFQLCAAFPGLEQCEVVSNGQLADSSPLPLALRIRPSGVATKGGPAQNFMASSPSQDPIIAALNAMIERRPREPGKYEDQFRDGGARRAEEIVNMLEQRWDARKGRAVYLSVGGADGSEAATALRRDWVAAAVNIEPSQTFADLSRRLGVECQSRTGKKLHTLQMKASDCQRADSDLASLLKLICNETSATAVIVSFKSVLHELPKRDPAFKIGGFLRICVNGFVQQAISVHEPVFPLEWRGESTNMYISSKRYSIQSLYALTRAVWERHHQRDIEPLIALNDRILMSRMTAADVLVKAMFVENLSYEIEESIVDFNMAALKRLLSESFCIIESDAKSSPTYRQRADEIGIELFNEDGVMPESFPMFFERVLWVSR